MPNIQKPQNRTQSVVSQTTAISYTPVVTYFSKNRSNRAELKPWQIAPLLIENISKQEAIRKRWEIMYGWMADYNSKGDFKPRKHTLENSTRFSDTTPNSFGHCYGWHLQTQLGKELKDLQTRYDPQYKKRASTEILGSD